MADDDDGVHPIKLASSSLSFKEEFAEKCQELTTERTEGFTNGFPVNIGIADGLEIEGELPGRFGHSCHTFIICHKSAVPQTDQAPPVVNVAAVDDSELGGTQIDTGVEIAPCSSPELEGEDPEKQIEMYPETARIANNAVHKSLGDSRFGSGVDIYETRKLLHGGWNNDSSIAMHLEISGPERDIEGIFGNVDIIMEEDILEDKTRRLLLSANHLYEFLYYNIDSTQYSPDIWRPAFKENEKHLVMFGGCLNLYRRGLSTFASNPKQVELVTCNHLYTCQAHIANIEWQLHELENAPTERAFFASCIVYASLSDPVLFIQGGIGSGYLELLPPNLHMLWLNPVDGQLKWSEFLTHGPQPPKRFGHSLSQLDSYLVLFGGTDGERNYNDVWVLDINHGVFEVPGYLSYNSWSKVDFKGLVPLPRAFHSCSRATMSTNGPIIIYGGVTNEVHEARSRFYALVKSDGGGMHWRILPVYVKCPIERRAFHTMTFVGDRFVIVGGEDFSNRLSALPYVLIYNIVTKLSQYIENVEMVAGHVSWYYSGLLYHWGGIRTIEEKTMLESDYVITNPRFYKDDEQIGDLYLHLLREREAAVLAQLGPNIPQEYLMHEQGLDQGVISIEALTDRDTIRAMSNTGSRPRRSAAIKCLKSIEIDNLRRAAAQASANEQNVQP
ncbi:Kelch-type beta propeller [Babesia duncani]|uniref:Kelch-type beta propeller n=1 Tax=Babesia duncani TaxID=323732 RepID=A0AAD9PPA0_9APIC|nr:Kelch-type beta propeller [Babesia duncani]